MAGETGPYVGACVNLTLPEMRFGCRLPCAAVSAFALIGTPYMVWWRGFQAGYRYTFLQRQPAAGQLVLDWQRISLTMSLLQICDLPETLSRLLASKTAH